MDVIALEKLLKADELDSEAGAGTRFPIGAPPT
jgi:hypothetical protein